jgi:hypothetical protein
VSHFLLEGGIQLLKSFDICVDLEFAEYYYCCFSLSIELLSSAVARGGRTGRLPRAQTKGAQKRPERARKRAGPFLLIQFQDVQKILNFYPGHKNSWLRLCFFSTALVANKLVGQSKKTDRTVLSS